MDDLGLKFLLGKPLRGWLRRHGGVMRGWQRKYCVVQDRCLFCFNREDDTRISHTYFLSDYQLKKVPNTADDPDKFAFELISEKSTGESVILSASSEEERKEWMKALGYHIYADKGGAIFGMPLEETMKFEHKKGRRIPYIVEACVQHLTAHAMESEGIFRLAGRAGLLRELREKFETGQNPSLEDVDVHTVGSLLKAYLRELPESLVVPDLYQRAMNFALRYSDASSTEARTKEVKGLAELLKDLPVDNHNTLSYICHFLSDIASNSEKTKMDTRNLSLVFGPNLIRHMDNSPELLMLTADLNQHFAYMVIFHCEEIFPPVPSGQSVNAESDVDSVAVRPKPRDVERVAVDDILRLSLPVDNRDTSLLSPQSAGLRDLMGLDLNAQQDWCSSDQSSCSPSSPFDFVVDYYSNSPRRGKGSSSSEPSRGISPVDNTGFDWRPVAPKRKARTLKGRKSGGGSLPSPGSPDLSRQLDSEDVLKALAAANSTAGAVSQSVQGKDSAENVSEIKSQGTEDKKGPCNSSQASRRQFFFSHDTNTSSEVSQKEAVSVVNDMESSTANSCQKLDCDSDTHKLGPSQTLLQAQNTAMKEELVSTKARSDQLVSALKNQLVDLRSNYETRISTMEAQHRCQVMDLSSKLDVERNARAEAVERTMTLQAQLYKYKLQYGELQDPH